MRRKRDNAYSVTAAEQLLGNASASVHFPQNIVRNLAKTASNESSELRSVDATAATYGREWHVRQGMASCPWTPGPDARAGDGQALNVG